jgi:hypothetical protein
VNSHRLKHNFKKVWGCFCKITRAGEFLELMNYFSIRKMVEWVHGAVDRVHGAGSQGP